MDALKKNVKPDVTVPAKRGGRFVRGLRQGLRTAENFLMSDYLYLCTVTGAGRAFAGLAGIAADPTPLASLMQGIVAFGCAGAGIGFSASSAFAVRYGIDRVAGRFMGVSDEAADRKTLDAQKFGKGLGVTAPVVVMGAAAILNYMYVNTLYRSSSCEKAPSGQGGVSAIEKGGLTDAFCAERSAAEHSAAEHSVIVKQHAARPEHHIIIPTQGNK